MFTSNTGQPCSPAKSKPLAKVGRKATGPAFVIRQAFTRLGSPGCHGKLLVEALLTSAKVSQTKVGDEAAYNFDS